MSEESEQVPGSDEPSPSMFETLMELQDRDTVLDQLHFRRQHLPERARAAQARSELAAVETSIAEVSETLAGLRDRQAALEREIDGVTERVRTIEKRMYGGEVSASRDLEAMAHEVESLTKHRSHLEDQEIQVMEEIEPVEALAAALGDRREQGASLAARIDEELASAEEVVGAEIRQEEQARAAIAARLPDALVGRYEKLRARLDGIGAARLVHGSCTGCHLELPSAELDRVRHAPADGVLTCDQCGRILVR